MGLAAPQRLAARRLHLDHVRTGLGEQEAGVRTLVDLTQVQNADPGERHGRLQWNEPPITSRATIRRWISFGPSPTRRMRSSRYQRSSGRSFVMP